MRMFSPLLNRNLAFALLPLMVACQTGQPADPSEGVLHSVPNSVQVPSDVERLAVLYRTSRDRDEMEAYSRLEGAAFQIKEIRPSLRIYERADMTAILTEQRLQLAGSVQDDTAVRAGRLLGVDSVLIYTIQGPSTRDRLFARRPDDIPPYLVSSKIIRIESAEVVFHNVVTAPIKESQDDSVAGLGMEFSPRPQLRDALDRGVSQTISDLRHAFR